MDEELRRKFLKVYNNLPLGIREEVIYVLDEKPMTWNAVFIEINAKTEIGDKILKKLSELKDVRADVVIGDVSGIATPVSYALNWYSTKVPTGGDDGTEVICEFLKRASRGPVKPNVRVYFPVAVDLSDKDKILDTVSKNFNKVENAWKKEYIEFPLSEPEVQAIHDVYEGRVPRFINVQKSRKGSFWRGQILMATYPKFR